jgi:hypothetical protein
MPKTSTLAHPETGWVCCQCRTYNQDRDVVKYGDVTSFYGKCEKCQHRAQTIGGTVCTHCPRVVVEAKGKVPDAKIFLPDQPRGWVCNICHYYNDGILTNTNRSICMNNGCGNQAWVRGNQGTTAVAATEPVIQMGIKAVILLRDASSGRCV